MTNVQVTWTVSQTAAQPGIVDAASVAFRGDGIFNGSGDLKNIAAVAVTFGGTLSADFTGAGDIAGASTGTVGSDIYNALRPIADPYDPPRGYPLLAYAEGIGSMLQELDDIVAHPERLLDPDQTPAKWVPWLGQFIDAGIPENGSGNEAVDRAKIKDPPRRRRGTVPAILEEVSKRLVGTRSIYYTERDVGGSAWHGFMAIQPSELAPGETQASIQALVNSIKPSPIIIDVNLAGGSDYNALLSTHTTYLQVYSTFADYNEVKRDPTKGATGGTTFSNIDGGAPAGAPTTTIDGGTVGSPYDAGYDGGTP
jgi:hypothetical protein